MHIIGPAHLHGPQPIGSPHGPQASKSAQRPDSIQITDELDISDAARLTDLANSAPEIRQERVDAIRTQIAQGAYETPEKLDVAVERLLDEIG